MHMNRGMWGREEMYQNAYEQGHVGKEGEDVLGMPVNRGMWAREEMYQECL